MQIDQFLQPFILAGVASLIVGSVGLGGQWRIQRFLAYSAISHLGFLFLALSCLQFNCFLYYLVIYGLTSGNLFAILGGLSGRSFHLSQLAGLNKQNLSIALALAFTLFSLAGIPPLSGFTAKLIVLQAYIGYYALIAVLASVLSAANYLHLIKISNLDLPLSPYPIAIPASISYLIAILSSFLLLFTLKFIYLFIS